jgi:DeoR family transcriptional regulator, ulaG and ulaABCDEF operon transcriptional repressor
MFMSCYAVTQMGVVEGDPLIARAEAKLLTRAEQLVVLADSSKFEARGSMAVCPLSRIHTLITDDAAPKAMLEQLQGRGVNIIVASEASGAALSAA